MSTVFHLARRFFRSLGARRPSIADQQFVATVLDPAVAPMFWAQSVPDQVHGIRVARTVVESAPERVDLARAALLHDVGKQVTSLGTIGRSVATVLDALGLPMTAAMGSYRNHAAIGAKMLAACEVEKIVVAFAAGHHGPCPDGVAARDWDLLARADHE
jgi:putative nucleotidyltransferase with HDIG domain